MSALVSSAPGPMSGMNLIAVSTVMYERLHKDLGMTSFTL